MLSKYIAGGNRILFNARAAQFSSWSHLTPAPADPILGLNEAFKAETNPKKVLLGMGVYRCDKGKPKILECVREAERRLLESNADHEYAGIQGIDSYIEKCIELGYGKNSKQRLEKRITGAQSISGTGALRLGLMFFKDWYPHKDIDYLVPSPTWPIHKTLGQLLGFNVKEYRYYDPKTKGFDADGMLQDLKNAKNHSFALFHVCAHNPTGVDPTNEQWLNILDVVKTKKIFCGFDSAYQGFASGDLERDAYSLQLFQQHTDDIFLFQSFAKNFGLYGERAGCFSVVCGSQEEAKIAQSRIKQIARPIYSNPPIHGARIVDIILRDPKLEAMWHQDLKDMSGRISEMRHGLKNRLKALGNEHNWDHLTNQIGMFAFTGLSKDQVNELREKYAIYMTMDGRISICGLNSSNLDYIAEGFHKVTHGKSF